MAKRSTKFQWAQGDIEIIPKKGALPERLKKVVGSLPKDEKAAGRKLGELLKGGTLTAADITAILASGELV